MEPRYSCALTYPTFYNIFWYRSNGMYAGMTLGELSNGGNAGNIHPK